MLTLNETMLEEVSGGTTNTTTILAKLKLNINSYNGNTQVNASNIGNGNTVKGFAVSGFIANEVMQGNSVG